MPATGDLAYNPGMCPDWELNPQTFSPQAGTQSIEPHQPGLYQGNTNHIELVESISSFSIFWKSLCRIGIISCLRTTFHNKKFQIFVCYKCSLTWQLEYQNLLLLKGASVKIISLWCILRDN